MAPQAEAISVDVISYGCFCLKLFLRLIEIETALSVISNIASICKSSCKNRHISFKCVNSCIVHFLSMDSSEESFTSNRLSMDSSFELFSFRIFHMDSSEELFSFVLFPIDSSKEFDQPSGHHLFLIMVWFWKLCPDLWRVQMPPLERQRC